MTLFPSKQFFLRRKPHESEYPHGPQPPDHLTHGAFALWGSVSIPDACWWKTARAIDRLNPVSDADHVALSFHSIERNASSPNWRLSRYLLFSTLIDTPCQLLLIPRGDTIPPRDRRSRFFQGKRHDQSFNLATY